MTNQVEKLEAELAGYQVKAKEAAAIQTKLRVGIAQHSTQEWTLANMAMPCVVGGAYPVAAWSRSR